MPSVKVRENEPFEFALRRFKRTCEKAGVLAETRKHAPPPYLGSDMAIDVPGLKEGRHSTSRLGGFPEDE